MNKGIKICIYIIVSILISLFIIFTVITIKASFGGLKLNFLENRISEEIESRFLLKTEFNEFILRNDKDRGFYFEIKKLKMSGKNDFLLETETIYWDFRIINLLTLSIDNKNKIHIKEINFSNLDLHTSIDMLNADYDKNDQINIKFNKLELSNNPKIALIDNKFQFNTNSYKKLLNSEINFETTLSVNDQKYETEANFIPNTSQINILKFRGRDLYFNDNSFIKFDNKYKTAKIQFDINAKKDPIINAIGLNNDSKISLFLDNFRGWHSILLSSNLKYSESQYFREFFDNLILKISGVYELGPLLPKDEFYSNFGDVTNYEIEFRNDRDKYVFNIQNIQNNQISLKKGSFFKLSKTLNSANVNLVTSIDKNAAINFLKTTILSRERDTGRVINFLNNNLNKENNVILNFNIDPSSIDIVKSLSNLYVISSGKLSTNFIFDDNKNPNFISGPVNYYIEIENLETDTPVLNGQIDLTGVEAFVRQINLNKEKNKTLKIQFEGDTNSLNDSVIVFDSLDSEIDFEGKIKITKTNHIFLDKLSINNNSNVNLNLSGDLSKRILNLKIKGNIIDLSKNKVEIKKKERNYYLKEENYSIITDHVIFTGSVKVDDFRASIEKKGSKLSVNSRATLNGNELKYSREKSDQLDVNIIKSNNIKYFVTNDHPAKKLLSDGMFKMTSIRNLNTSEASVKIELNDFVLINTPASLKLLSLPSISGLVSIAEGEQGIRFGYGEINYLETGDKLRDIEAFAVSDSLGLIMEGSIDKKEKIIDMRGEISPMHLVNAIIQKLPIVGPIIVGNEGEGMFSIDFIMTGPSDDPDVESNPLTIIKPRIIERAIEAFDSISTIQ